MSVLHLLGTAGEGGAETYFVDLVTALAGSGQAQAAVLRANAGRHAALADGLGLSERVRFLGWRTDASSLYRTADLCVFPSRYEPLGNVVIQAWAHGLPVVAAASTGPAALIRDGEDGRLVTVDDPAALASAIRDLLDDATGRRTLAEAGLARVAGEFSRAAVVDRWRELFAAHGAG